jgi:flagellar hook-associated protein 1 FlgK
MSLSSAYLIANGSLSTISTQISTVSRNISNSGTRGYSEKYAQIVTDYNGGAVIRSINNATDLALFKSLLQSTAGEANSSSLAAGVSALAQLMISSSGSSNVTSGNSPVAKLAALKAALQQYDAAPSDTTAAGAVLSSAKDLVESLNNASTATQQAREQADADIGSAVTNINDLLAQFQKVNSDIVAGTAANSDVTDLLDQRNNLLTQLSSQVGVRTLTRANNDMVIYTDNGATLFETTPRAVTFQPSAALGAGASGSAVYVDGIPITGQNPASQNIQSGALAGLTQIRDVVAPKFQNQLDEIARGLVSAFSESDQTGGGAPTRPGLFTFPGATGAVGSTLVPGLASLIQVNANADPSQGGDITRLRDGGISDPTNPAYKYNTTGAAGFSGRIEQLLSNLQAPQAFDPAAGLDQNASLVSYATESQGWLAAQKQQADNGATFQSALLAQTSQAFSNATGVNLDSEMSKMVALENSYQASAKLLTTIDSMFQALLDATRG